MCEAARAVGGGVCGRGRPRKVEDAAILEALVEHGPIRRAAAALGVHESSLRERLEAEPLRSLHRAIARGRLSAMDDGKRCTRCGQFKTWAEFGALTNHADGKHSYCKHCKRDYKARRDSALAGVAHDGYAPTEIFDRDGWRCGICRERIDRRHTYPHPRCASVDHIVPLAKGGDDTRRNVQAAHLDCNLRKRHKGTGDQLRLIG
jgi:hypothetical protein